ncbi:hypothetical protein IHQ71_28275 [Rhizobium sp. TH2]|uniref:hypothetical protein n=1 Tax=Rhizobium sp. TH2 TaxID=2775403 RepID=UPI0021570401|nr:hypothetical protein [Rhizobium sp. TH2]UVC08965.1 hypothetical protein IHQ71_28275 [Rhizobium sp. TH2]
MKISLFAGFALTMISSVSYADEWRSQAIEQIKTAKVVIDATFTQPSSLWVSVHDDGTRRDGLAESFCVDLFSAGMPVGSSVIITVWDAAAMAREDLVELGKYQCERTG